MNKEAIAEIQRLFDQEAKTEQENKRRKELAKECHTFAVEILEEYGDKTPPIEITIGGKSANIYLERSLDPDGDTNLNRHIWVTFEDDKTIPEGLRVTKNLFHFGHYLSVSSYEGELRTSTQFAGLKNVLEFIKTSLESSPASAEPSMSKK